MSEIQATIILGEIWRLLVVEDVKNADEIHARFKDVIYQNVTK